MVNVCPKCTNKQIDNHIVNAYGVNWGSPIKRCLICNTEYLDNRYQEAAIYEKPKSRLKIREIKYAGIGMLFGPLMLLVNSIRMTLFNFSSDGTLFYGGIILTCFSIILAVIFTLAALENHKNYKKALEESQGRLQDGEYKDKLIKYGYMN